ncbi:MAG TPA: hypothetical protein VMW17_22385 [Candidatus Binatia bacterium]|nr:hypothetical protein [Candidatus Binatia bacterium]
MTRGLTRANRIASWIVAFAILLAAAPAPVAAAACVGDCNELNGVTIEEVQHTVNIYLDTADLSGCPNADRDHDGRVTIDEVQAAVLSYLGDVTTCPTVVPLTPTAEATTATPTPTPTASSTDTPTATRSSTLTLTPTQSDTPTATPIPADTATPTLTNTRTPSPTPTKAPVCGNGFLESGETCTSCAADCVVKACTATTPLRTFAVTFAAPAGQDVSGITVLVGYKSGTVSLPGKGNAATVSARIKNKPSNVIFSAFDLDYALRTVLSRSTPIPLGLLYTIDFDSCTGATAPTAADFGCTVEGCANQFGDVSGCTCAVTQP